MVVKLNSEVGLREEIDTFLETFAYKDKKSISNSGHATMMMYHFYYVDSHNQGWYVLDEPDNLFRNLTGDEVWVYGELYQNAEAYP